LLSGKLALEDQPLSTLIDALGTTEGSALGSGANEVLRTARTFSQLRDQVENYGWKSINETELTAIFERNNDDVNQSGIPQSRIYSFPHQEVEVDVASVQAFRMTLASCLRTYCSLNMLPSSVSSASSSLILTSSDVTKLFDLTESIIVLGTRKRSVSDKSIYLFKSMVGPHVLSIAVVSFSLILRSLPLFCKRLLTGSQPSDVNEDFRMLEHLHRKTADLLRLIGMLLPLFDEISAPGGSIVPAKLGLFIQSNIKYSDYLGDLAKASSESAPKDCKSNSPLNQTDAELSREFDDYLGLIRGCGPTGLVLSSIDDEAAWNSQNSMLEGVGFESLAA